MLLSLDRIGMHHVALSGEVAEALVDVSFDLDAGQFLSIVGPSGSGKSTLLNLIAGVYTPTSGSIQYSGGKLPHLGYLLQSNALFPWRTVRRNLTYSNDLRRISREQSDTEATELCRQLGLDPQAYLDKYPRELSGGEQRRVALGMAVAMAPAILLLDEPGSQLDYKAKWAIQRLVQEIAMRHRFAVICVTHDLEEAVFLGDRVIVLNAGRVEDRVEIDLPRPRRNELRTSAQFNAYIKRLMGEQSN